MKPLGKAMKSGFWNKVPEQKVLKDVLKSYRDTPHPATGVSSGAMMFRDGYQVDLSRIQLSEKQVAMARLQDMKKKEDRKKDVNDSKHRKISQIYIGDKVLVRNYIWIKKFEPYFIPEPFIIEDVNKFKVMVKRERDGLRLTRHPDDLKLFKGDYHIVDHQLDVTAEGNAGSLECSI